MDLKASTMSGFEQVKSTPAAQEGVTPKKGL